MDCILEDVGTPLFAARMHFLVSLDYVKQRYKSMSFSSIAPPTQMTHVKAECAFVELEDRKKSFSFEYYHIDKIIRRDVMMHVYILRYRPEHDHEDYHYYLFAGTCVDKTFKGKDSQAVSESELCTEMDLAQMKRAFYGGFFNNEGNDIQTFYNWLDDLLQDITGREYKGRYGRHYMVDVRRVMVDSITSSKDNKRYTENDLTDAFSPKYYGENSLPIEVVFPNYQKFAYGLLFGNENYERVPQKQLDMVLKDGYSNNYTGITLAGGSTVVYLDTHHSFPYKRDHDEKKYNFDQTVSVIQNIYEMCSVLDAKRRLKRIKELVKREDASKIKEALSEISVFLSRNPLRLNEADLKMRYLYEQLEVQKLFNTVSKMGELLSDAIQIRQAKRTNGVIALLTTLTVILGGVQIVQNYINFKFKIVMNPCNCNSAIQVDCSCVVCILLLLVLIGIVFLIVQKCQSSKTEHEIKDVIRGMIKRGEL